MGSSNQDLFSEHTYNNNQTVLSSKIDPKNGENRSPTKIEIFGASKLPAHFKLKKKHAQFKGNFVSKRIKQEVLKKKSQDLY